MRRYSLYVLDLDGTLYRGDQVLPGAVETVATLKQTSQVRFLTNNSGKSAAEQRDKLTRLGIDAELHEILNSGIGTADYLVGKGIRTAFVVGELALEAALREKGIAIDGDNPAAVVCGICRALSYDLIDQAMQHIRRGATFIATNTDATYPMEAGRLVPGAGAGVAAIRTCAEVEPFVVGKPNPYLIQVILREANVPPQDTLVVGDRYETDIVSGQRAGCDVVLTLTGVTREPIEGIPSVQSLPELLGG